MSRLTGAPFHKPSPFEFPPAPLSPPETNPEAIGPAVILSSASHHDGHDLRHSELEASPARTAPTPESAGARFRRISSMAYHSSGLRESRERARASKAFVIIIPPTSLIQEHGQLGHTLSSGPRHRLTNGLLMPLFPTMYGQLTAIAREFNFPSTAGLCLYPHFVDNGVTTTPRISDDSWPFVWAHILETSSAPKPPIGGKIEFDIDMRQARWYASWLASSQRDYVDHTLSAFHSAAPPIFHERVDSKTTFHEDDQEETHSTAPTTRHVPRKLSLVDRYDMLSIRSSSRPASRSVLSPPEHPYPSSRVLSPIFQDEEPKSAKHDLDNRVNSWRENTIQQPTLLAVTGQTSLEPANMPNSLPINDTLLNIPADQLNLEDFAWSVSSAGPNDYDPMSPMSWDRVPSVHIAHRVEGSVCLTPSNCTSFGPSDYTLPSPEPSIFRLPSPDIAHRMYEDMPPTPSTATSWGAPIEFPPSPIEIPRPSSVDLGERGLFSRPVTPSTATSWGPASWPSSPMYSEYCPRSVHLGDRGDFSRPVTPSTATSLGAPLSYPPSPITPFYVSTPDAGHRGFEDSEYDAQLNTRPWGYSWPYNRSKSVAPEQKPNARPWGYSWPYNRSKNVVSERKIQHAPWGHSWPYTSLRLSVKENPYNKRPWTHSWPYRDFSRTKHETVELTVRVPSAYPRLVIYHPVYPHFNLYPAVVLSHTNVGYLDINPDISPSTTNKASPAPQRPVIVRLAPSYPSFCIYPAIYPGNLSEIYPAVNVNGPSSASIPAPSYPAFDLYPTKLKCAAPIQDVERTHKDEGYPIFNLYPPMRDSAVGGTMLSIYEPSGYPYFDLYPPVKPVLGSMATTPTGPSISIRAKAAYPFFDLYPAVYPYFNLYPALNEDIPDVLNIVSLALSSYPESILYLPVAPRATKQAESSVRLTDYPTFNLYPALYPAFEIYPRVELEASTNEKEEVSPKLNHPLFDCYEPLSTREAHKSLPVRLPSLYPSFNIYPPVYPILEIYPPIFYATSSAVEVNNFVANSVVLEYPAFNLYPGAHYPHFDLYPITLEKVKYRMDEGCSVKIEAVYPAFDLYPAVYPHFELWPSTDVLPRIEQKLQVKENPSHRLTHRELHAMVMMERVRTTGSFQPIDSIHHRPSRAVRSHSALHHAVFPDGIVATPSGTWESSQPVKVSTGTRSPSEALRRRISTLRPSSAKSALPASPRPIRHPAQPLIGQDSPLPNAFNSLLTLGLVNSQASPPQTASSHLLSQDPQDPRQRYLPTLGRSSSLTKAPSASSELVGNTIRPTSVIIPPRRRDSLVSHRIRVYNGCTWSFPLDASCIASPSSTIAQDRIEQPNAQPDSKHS